MKKITFFIVILLFGALTMFSQTTILNEDFESASGTTPPTGWTTSSNGVGWKFGNRLGSTYWHIPNHTKYAASNDDAGGQNNDGSVDYLISPTLDLSSYTTVFFKFAKYFTGEYHQVAKIEASSDGGTTWTEIFVVPASDNWEVLTISLAAYAGQANVKVRFHADDTGHWASGFAVDDVQIYEPAANDVSLVSINTAPYVQAGNVNIEGTLKNLGQTALTAVDVLWSIDGGANFTTDHLTGLNVAPADTYDFTHSISIDMSATHGYDVMVKLANPNGNTDDDPSNNSLTKQIASLSQIPTKRIVGEESGGTWCGWCPRGLVALKDMAHYHPDNWIGIAVHSGDPMVNTAYNTALNTHRGTSSAPGGMVDRKGGDIDPGDFSNVFDARSAELTPVEIGFTNINWDSATNELSFDVTATFYTNFTGDFRINAIIKEDGVHGTTSAWGQHNYYHNQYDLIDWEGVNWKNLPATVPAADMVYNHVGREMLGGWDGSAGSIPANIVDGDVYSQHYTYTVPANSNINNIKIVGLVIDQNTGYILNGKETTPVAASVETNTLSQNISIYPNPSNGEFFIDNIEGMEISIFNNFGQKIYYLDNSPAHIGVNIDHLSKGIYLIRVRKGEQYGLKKLIIK